jgi:hypothetical protein
LDKISSKFFESRIDVDILRKFCECRKSAKILWMKKICRNSLNAENLQKFCKCRKSAEILWMQKICRNSAEILRKFSDCRKSAEILLHSANAEKLPTQKNYQRRKTTNAEYLQKFYQILPILKSLLPKISYKKIKNVEKFN